MHLQAQGSCLGTKHRGWWQGDVWKLSWILCAGFLRSDLNPIKTLGLINKQKRYKVGWVAPLSLSAPAGHNDH